MTDASNNIVKPRPRSRRLVLPGIVILLLLASIAGNVVLCVETRKNYRDRCEAQLDPYGLKHPDFRTLPSAAGELPLVLFYGDSRARDWPAPPMTEYRFVSRGIYWQTTEQIRGRFDVHVKPLSPRIVVVEAGINDLKAIPLLPDRRDEIVADCKANIRDIVLRAWDGGATVVVVTLFPTGPVPLERRLVWSSDIDRAVEEVNADLRALASDRVIVLDAWKLLEDHGRLRDGCSKDTLHLNATGYGVLNAELTRILKGLPAKAKQGA